MGALLFAWACLPAGSAAAATFPNGPVRIVVPFAAGTWVDSVTRLLADKVAAQSGQPLVVENRPGASGLLAANAVAKAPADGHTLLVGGVFLTTLVAIDAPNAVDPLRAFVPVTRWTNAPILIVANPSLEVRALADLLARARRENGPLSYAT